MMTGFYIVIARENLVKTIIGLNIFQTSVFLLYITMGKVTAARLPSSSQAARTRELASRVSRSRNRDHAQPIGQAANGRFEEMVNGTRDSTRSTIIYSNPIPSVLMLTAIVVGIATTALALALIVRIREDYGTIEEDEILELDRNS